MDGCQSWKLALEISANFVATRAGIQREFLALDSSASFWRWIPAPVSGKCVMGIIDWPTVDAIIMYYAIWYNGHL